MLTELKHYTFTLFVKYTKLINYLEYLKDRVRISYTVQSKKKQR